MKPEKITLSQLENFLFKAADILRGKDKPIFTPHLDTGDMVVIINAEKIRVTGKKMTDKIYQRYSGYPSGQRRLTLQQLLKKAPARVMRLAINRMIPKNPQILFVIIVLSFQSPYDVQVSLIKNQFPGI